MLTRYEQMQLDVDWYCLINGYPAHIASMGGVIPVSFCHRYELRMIEDAVVALPDICDIELNEGYIFESISSGYEYIDRLDNFEETGPFSNFIEHLIAGMPSCDLNGDYPIAFRLFASSFVQKAKKGFNSYSRIGATNEYELVARPLMPCDWQNRHICLKPLFCDGTSEIVDRIEINAEGSYRQI